MDVPISGRNARRVVFGTLNIETGHRLFLARQRQRSEDFRAFLPVVARHYRGRSVALLLDEDPSHTAQASLALAYELGMQLMWLPKRCPELNGMDHLWGHGKDHVCANRQYDDIDAETLTAELGERWETPRIAFKPYPACHYVHASLDAAFTGGFAFPALQRLTELSEAALLDCIDEALAALLIRPLGARSERYDFMHAIVRHTLYDKLSPSRRVA